jgi:hypothetical protein
MLDEPLAGRAADTLQNVAHRASLPAQIKREYWLVMGHTVAKVVDDRGGLRYLIWSHAMPIGKRSLKRLIPELLLALMALRGEQKAPRTEAELSDDVIMERLTPTAHSLTRIGPRRIKPIESNHVQK